ncbi:MAG: hypothetical protein QOF11_194, partial [Chloroflexota bacterium]|nr:hypothetical protein [Chloroflexota bacterium]
MKLDLVFEYDREIVWDAIDDLQDVLVALAPRWSQDVRAWRHREHDIPIDMNRRGALKEATVAVGTERGPLYRSLTSLADAERSGAVELRG